MKLLKATFGLFVLSASVFAHSLWVNSFESTAHKPGHAIVSLGWGHELPLGDMLNSPGASVAVSDFYILDPKGKKIALYKPENAAPSSHFKNESLEIYKADFATQKVALSDKPAKGVYTVAATSQKAYYTIYLDKNSKQHFKPKAKDELPDIATLITSTEYQAFAKSYFSVDKWDEQKPIGHALEIIPLTDLSNVKAGDLVKFKVLFNGKPLNVSFKSIEYLTATSNSFGQEDGYQLFSYILNGVAQFRLPSKGQWLLNIYHTEQLDPSAKDYKKFNTQMTSATLTFNVK